MRSTRFIRGSCSSPTGSCCVLCNTNQFKRHVGSNYKLKIEACARYRWLYKISGKQNELTDYPHFFLLVCSLLPLFFCCKGQFFRNVLGWTCSYRLRCHLKRTERLNPWVEKAPSRASFFLLYSFFCFFLKIFVEVGPCNAPLDHSLTMLNTFVDVHIQSNELKHKKIHTTEATQDAEGREKKTFFLLPVASLVMHIKFQISSSTY